MGRNRRKKVDVSGCDLGSKCQPTVSGCDNTATILIGVQTEHGSEAFNLQSHRNELSSRLSATDKLPDQAHSEALEATEPHGVSSKEVLQKLSVLQSHLEAKELMSYSSTQRDEAKSRECLRERHESEDSVQTADEFSEEEDFADAEGGDEDDDGYDSPASTSSSKKYGGRGFDADTETASVPSTPVTPPRTPCMSGRNSFASVQDHRDSPTIHFDAGEFTTKMAWIALHCYFRRWKEQKLHCTSQITDLLRAEAAKDIPDKKLIRRYCLSTSCDLPEEVRGTLWQILLGAEEREGTRMDMMSEHLSQTITMEIREDCQTACRTVPGIIGGTFHAGMEMLLSSYCSQTRIRYHKGFAHIIAPFFLLDLPLFTMFECFKKFCDLMLSHMDFSSEQPFKATAVAKRPIFRLLLYYHSPKLGRHLDREWPNWHCDSDAIPDEWLSFFLAGTIPPSALLYILQQALILEDPELSLFVGLGAILVIEDKLVALRQDSLKAVLRGHVAEAFNSYNNVTDICAKARSLWRQSPSSYRHRFQQSGTFLRVNSALSRVPNHGRGLMAEHSLNMNLWLRKESIKYPNRFYWVNSLTGQSQWQHPAENGVAVIPDYCLSISVDEVLSQLMYKRPAGQPGIQCYLIDCRSVKNTHDTASGRFPTSFNVDPSCLEDKKLFLACIEDLAPLKDRAHLVLMPSGLPAMELGEGDEYAMARHRAMWNKQKSVVSRIALRLQKFGYRHVSLLEEGYVGCHTFVANSPIGLSYLSEHDCQKCPICQSSRNQRVSQSISSDTSEDDTCDYKTTKRNKWSLPLGRKKLRPPSVKAILPDVTQAAARSKNAVGSRITMLKRKSLKKGPETSDEQDVTSIQDHREYAKFSTYHKSASSTTVSFIDAETAKADNDSMLPLRRIRKLFLSSKTVLKSGEGAQNETLVIEDTDDDVDELETYPKKQIGSI